MTNLSYYLNQKQNFLLNQDNKNIQVVMVISNLILINNVKILIFRLLTQQVYTLFLNIKVLNSTNVYYLEKYKKPFG